jgi:hypothetical protein
MNKHKLWVLVILVICLSATCALGEQEPALQNTSSLEPALTEPAEDIGLPDMFTAYAKTKFSEGCSAPSELTDALALSSSSSTRAAAV